MPEFKCVSKAFGKKQVLRDFSFALPERGVVALMGPSGCGKTTLLRLLAGLERPDSGEVILPPDVKISVVFQEDRLLPTFDARENVRAALGRDTESFRRADECLFRLGLSEAVSQYPDALSGGMKRRVAIARALAFGGDILLLDEPFKGLDDATKKQAIDFVFEDKNRLTVLVTHDKDEARAADCVFEFTGPPITQV